jgi:hypothetical protein
MSTHSKVFKNRVCQLPVDSWNFGKGVIAIDYTNGILPDIKE